jgi:hypothetical protein
MIINSTLKTRDNDYLENTENIAMVHINRTVDAGDTTLTPFKVVVENLTTVHYVIFEVSDSSGVHTNDYPAVSISKNVITFTDAVPFTNTLGYNFTIYAFGV